MKTRMILIFLSVIVVLLSCKKNSDDTRIVLCYDETESLDPWDFSEIDEQLVVNINDYLRHDSIDVDEITIVNDGILEICKAAYCRTGRRIKVKIDENDLIKIRKIGFYSCDSTIKRNFR